MADRKHSPRQRERGRTVHINSSSSRARMLHLEAVSGSRLSGWGGGDRSTIDRSGASCVVPSLIDLAQRRGRATECASLLTSKNSASGQGKSKRGLVARAQGPLPVRPSMPRSLLSPSSSSWGSSVCGITIRRQLLRQSRTIGTVPVICLFGDEGKRETERAGVVSGNLFCGREEPSLCDKRCTMIKYWHSRRLQCTSRHAQQQC